MNKNIENFLNEYMINPDPILCGRAAKVGKTLTKFLSAIVLKHEVDVDKDNNFDFEIELGLDSVLLLFSSEDNSVKKGKLLIFDDIERCEMPMKRLMGYLNYFVELCHSHLSSEMREK